MRKLKRDENHLRQENNETIGCPIRHSDECASWCAWYQETDSQIDKTERRQILAFCGDKVIGEIIQGG